MTYHLYIPPYSETNHFASRDEVLQALGGLPDKQLGRNIYLFRDGQLSSADPCLRAYTTTVLRWTRDGDIVLNTGGWYTKATSEIMNRYLPPYFAIVPKDGQWYVQAYMHVYPMYEGMRLHIENGQLAAGHEIFWQEAQERVTENKRMKRQIATYLAGLDVSTLDRDMRGSPLCCMETTDGQTVADATNDHSHLLDHMHDDPPYYPFALLVAAFKERHPDNWQTALPYWTDPRYGNAVYVRRVLGKYMKKRLLRGAVSV